MRFFSTFITGFGEVVKSEIPKVLKNIRLELLTDGLIIYQTTSSGYGGNSAAPERSAGAKRRRSVVGIGLVKSSDFIQETQPSSEPYREGLMRQVSREVQFDMKESIKMIKDLRVSLKDFEFMVKNPQHLWTGKNIQNFSLPTGKFLK